MADLLKEIKRKQIEDDEALARQLQAEDAPQARPIVKVAEHKAVPSVSIMPAEELASLALIAELETEQQRVREQQTKADAELAASLSEPAASSSAVSAISVKQQQALAKVTAEYEQLCKILPAVESVGLQEENVHHFSQAGFIRAAFAYTQALDREYSLSRRVASIAVVCENILKVGSEVQANLLADAAIADVENKRKAEEAAKLRQDAAAGVLGNMRADLLTCAIIADEESRCKAEEAAKLRQDAAACLLEITRAKFLKDAVIADEERKRKVEEAAKLRQDAAAGVLENMQADLLVCAKVADVESAANAEIAAGLRRDAVTIGTSVAKVIASVKASSDVDGETGVALQDLLIRTWFLATLDVLVGSRTPEMVYRNLSLNIETGGGCIPGIIVRLEVAHIFCIRGLLECMIRRIIPIPPALSSAIITPPPMPAFVAHCGSAPSASMTSARVMPVPRVSSVPSISKSDEIAKAVAKRREFLNLKVRLGEFKADVEATLKAHEETLTRSSMEYIQEIIVQDSRKVGILKQRLPAEPKL